MLARLRMGCSVFLHPSVQPRARPTHTTACDVCGLNPSALAPNRNVALADELLDQMEAWLRVGLTVEEAAG